MDTAVLATTPFGGQGAAAREAILLVRLDHVCAPKLGAVHGTIGQMRLAS